MPEPGLAATMAAMQTVLTPLPARSKAPGHLVAELPGAPPGSSLHLHTISPGALAQWQARAAGALLVLTDGLGKVALEGATLRVAAPCVVRLPAAATLRLANQGSEPMRVLVIAPVEHCAAADRTVNLE